MVYTQTAENALCVAGYFSPQQESSWSKKRVAIFSDFDFRTGANQSPAEVQREEHESALVRAVLNLLMTLGEIDKNSSILPALRAQARKVTARQYQDRRSLKA